MTSIEFRIFRTIKINQSFQLNLNNLWFHRFNRDISGDIIICGYISEYKGVLIVWY